MGFDRCRCGGFSAESEGEVEMAIPTAILTIAKSIGVFDFIRNLIGLPPSNKYDRFGATIYRVMAAQAQAAQLDVYAFWFGDTIRVQPSGQFQVVGKPNTIEIYETYLNQLKMDGQSFFGISCQAWVDWEKDQDIQSGCTMIPYGPKAESYNTGGGGDPSGGAPVSSAGMVGVAAIAGILLALLWKKF